MHLLKMRNSKQTVIMKCWYNVNMLRLHSYILQDSLAVMHHDPALVVKVTPGKLNTFVTYNNGNSTKSHHCVIFA